MFGIKMPSTMRRERLEREEKERIAALRSRTAKSAAERRARRAAFVPADHLTINTIPTPQIEAYALSSGFGAHVHSVAVHGETSGLVGRRFQHNACQRDDRAIGYIKGTAWAFGAVAAALFAFRWWLV